MTFTFRGQNDESPQGRIEKASLYVTCLENSHLNGDLSKSNRIWRKRNCGMSNPISTISFSEFIKISLEPKKTPYFPLYWLFKNPHITGQYNPLYTPKHPRYFSLALPVISLTTFFRWKCSGPKTCGWPNFTEQDEKPETKQLLDPHVSHEKRPGRILSMKYTLLNKGSLFHVFFEIIPIYNWAVQ